MKLQLIILAIVVVSCNAVYEENVQILRKCLRQLSVSSGPAEWHKIKHYSNWTVEEIPCFTRCIATEKGWFNESENLWKKQQIVDDLGEDMYNYCRFELDRTYENGCEFAHKGLRCLKQAEEYTLKTNINLILCAKDLNATETQLQLYAQFPPQEVVPCLFKCFAIKMNLYSPEFEWNFENWIKAFGPTRQKNHGTSNTCKASIENIKQVDKCAWMYEEYTCFERLNYNTDGSADKFVDSTISTTMRSISVRETVVSTESADKNIIENNQV